MAVSRKSAVPRRKVALRELAVLRRPAVPRQRVAPRPWEAAGEVPASRCLAVHESEARPQPAVPREPEAPLALAAAREPGAPRDLAVAREPGAPRDLAVARQAGAPREWVAPAAGCVAPASRAAWPTNSATCRRGSAILLMRLGPAWPLAQGSVAMSTILCAAATGGPIPTTASARLPAQASDPTERARTRGLEAAAAAQERAAAAAAPQPAAERLPAARLPAAPARAASAERRADTRSA